MQGFLELGGVLPNSACMDCGVSTLTKVSWSVFGGTRPTYIGGEVLGMLERFRACGFTGKSWPLDPVFLDERSIRLGTLEGQVLVGDLAEPHLHERAGWIP